MFKYLLLIQLLLTFFIKNAIASDGNKVLFKSKKYSFDNTVLPNFSIYTDIKLLPIRNSFGVFHFGLNKAVSENTNLYYNLSTSLVYKNHYIPSLKGNELMGSLNYIFANKFIIGLYGKLGRANYQYVINKYNGGKLVSSFSHKYHTNYFGFGIKQGKIWGSKSGKIAQELSVNLGLNFFECFKRDSFGSPYVTDTWFFWGYTQSEFYKGLPIVTGFNTRLNIEFSYKFYFALGRKKNYLD